MNYISIKNLNFSYPNKKIFNDINLSIEKGSLVSITASNSQGKTTLLNIIYGNIDANCSIYVNKKKLNKKNIENFQSKVTYFSCDIRFYSKTVLDELLMDTIDDSTKNKNKIKQLLKEFNLINYAYKSPQSLSYIESQKLNLIKAILNKSELLILDDIFSYFDNYSKIEFIGAIKKYQIDNNATVIYTTTDLNDIIFSDKVIMIKNKEIIYDGPVDKIYLDEKILKTSNINVPIYSELMKKLKLYDIIDDNVCTIDEMVEEICR